MLIKNTRLLNNNEIQEEKTKNRKTVEKTGKMRQNPNGIN